MAIRTWSILVLLALGAGLLTACENPFFCATCPNHDRRDGGGPGSCSGDAECLAQDPARPVCDLDAMTCVQCTPLDHGACAGATPVCGDDRACRACSAHAECPASEVCLPDGACADPAQVAYVTAGGTGAPPCTQAAPCGTLQDGVTAVAAARPYIKIVGTGTLADTKTTTIDGKAVTILADPGAKLDRTGDGVILEVRNTGADVRIFDLEITGASGAAGDVGISIPAGGMPKLALTRVKVTNNQGGGLTASGGSLTIAQSTIANNTGGGLTASGGSLTIAQSTVKGNTAGGLSLTGTQFDITNSLIAGNGGPLALVGGIDLAQVPAAGLRRMDFNTITANAGTATINSGVNCGTVAAPVTFSNNIIYGNTVSGGGKQLGGSANCLATYSDIGPDMVTGMGNLNADPLFVNVLQGDFHLQAGSPAKDAADPAASLATDIDGDPRPQGPRRDIGADEIR